MKRGRVFRNIYKGHMDKSNGGVEASEGGGYGWGRRGGGGGGGGGKSRQL